MSFCCQRSNMASSLWSGDKNLSSALTDMTPGNRKPHSVYFPSARLIQTTCGGRESSAPPSLIVSTLPPLENIPQSLICPYRKYRGHPAKCWGGFRGQRSQQSACFEAGMPPAWHHFAESRLETARLPRPAAMNGTPSDNDLVLSSSQRFCLMTSCSVCVTADKDDDTQSMGIQQFETQNKL